VKGHKEAGQSSTTTTATEVTHLDEEDEAEKIDHEAIKKELALHRSV